MQTVHFHFPSRYISAVECVFFPSGFLLTYHVREVQPYLRAELLQRATELIEEYGFKACKVMVVFMYPEFKAKFKVTYKVWIGCRLWFFPQIFFA